MNHLNIYVLRCDKTTSPSMQLKSKMIGISFYSMGQIMSHKPCGVMPRPQHCQAPGGLQSTTESKGHTHTAAE